MKTQLGKIAKASYGFGGYDDAMFGLSVTLSMDGGSSGVGDFKGQWQTYSDRAQYSKEEWNEGHLKTALQLMELLTQAKVKDVSGLVGVPVEVTLDGNRLESWRILTEVL